MKTAIQLIDKLRLIKSEIRGLDNLITSFKHESATVDKLKNIQEDLEEQHIGLELMLCGLIGIVDENGKPDHDYKLLSMYIKF